MPTKNLKPVKTYLSQEQIDAIRAIDPAGWACLIRGLLKRHVERHGGTWPEITERGKYLRYADDSNPNSKTI